jgi:hypothetical protein
VVDQSKGSLNLSLDDMKKVSDEGVAATPEAKPAPVSKFDQQWRLFEKRLDYGWKFFDFHARQRMSMFNFFLLFVGFIFAGYGTLFKDGNFFVAAFVAGLGAFLTLVFILLDRRNEELVHIAEDVLLPLETGVLFKEYDHYVLWPHRRKWWGKMYTEKATKPSGIFLRQAEEERECGKSRCEHGFWIPFFQIVVVVTFSALAGFATYRCYVPPASVDGPQLPSLQCSAITVPVFVTTPPPSCPPTCTKIKRHGSGNDRNKEVQPCK